MFGSEKKQRSVTFVQPIDGEAFFYTPLAYSVKMQSSKDDAKHVFRDSDLALAGKLKLIFEREKMVWFEVKEEKTPNQTKDERMFVLYYYPHRLVTDMTSTNEKATLREVHSLFNFILTKDQTRFAEVEQLKTPSPYGSIPEVL